MTQPLERQGKVFEGGILCTSLGHWQRDKKNYQSFPARYVKTDSVCVCSAEKEDAKTSSNGTHSWGSGAARTRD